MEITEVRVRKVYGQDPNGRMKAVASVTIDQQFVVHEVRVVEGTNGLFVAMPSRRGNDGTFRDIAHPITSEARTKIQQAVLDAYGKWEKKPTAAVAAPGAGAGTATAEAQSS